MVHTMGVRKKISIKIYPIQTHALEERFLAFIFFTIEDKGFPPLYCPSQTCFKDLTNRLAIIIVMMSKM